MKKNLILVFVTMLISVSLFAKTIGKEVIQNEEINSYFKLLPTCYHFAYENKCVHVGECTQYSFCYETPPPFAMVWGSHMLMQQQLYWMDCQQQMGIPGWD